MTPIIFTKHLSRKISSSLPQASSSSARERGRRLPYMLSSSAAIMAKWNHGALPGSKKNPILEASGRTASEIKNMRPLLMASIGGIPRQYHASGGYNISSTTTTTRYRYYSTTASSSSSPDHHDPHLQQPQHHPQHHLLTSSSYYSHHHQLPPPEALPPAIHLIITPHIPDIICIVSGCCGV